MAIENKSFTPRCDTIFLLGGAFQQTFWLIQFGLTRLVVVLYIQVRFFCFRGGRDRGIPLSPINHATITKIPSSTMQAKVYSLRYGLHCVDRYLYSYLMMVNERLLERPNAIF